MHTLSHSLAPSPPFPHQWTLVLLTVLYQISQVPPTLHFSFPPKPTTCCFLHTYHHSWIWLLLMPVIFFPTTIKPLWLIWWTQPLRWAKPLPHSVSRATWENPLYRLDGIPAYMSRHQANRTLVKERQIPNRGKVQIGKKRYNGETNVMEWECVMRPFQLLLREATPLRQTLNYKMTFFVCLHPLSL